MLTEMEDRLSAVTRWGIIRVLQKQTVTDHSFRVTLIADKVAREWFKVTDPTKLYSVSYHALRHDRLEAVSGDFPGIIKDLVNEDGLSTRYADQFPAYKVTPLAKKVVKIADRIEALMFLRLELALGNSTVEYVIADVQESLNKYLHEIGRPDLWQRYIDEILYGGWSATGMKCHPMNRMGQ